MAKRANIQRWRESAVGLERVDSDEGVLRGVHVLGLESENDRTYEGDAASQAAPLYENVPVYIDHNERVKPGEPRQDRKIKDRWGMLRDVRKGANGLVADLYYLKSHPMTPVLLEMADRFDGSFGLSHDANGVASRNADGSISVREITKVNSVDVVCDPATTAGLFESITESEIEEPMKKTVKIRESVKQASKSALRKNLAQWLKSGKSPKRLREMVGDQDVEMDEEEDEEKKPSLSFKRAIEMVMDDEELNEMDKLSAIREMCGGPHREAEEEDPKPVSEAEDEEEMEEAEDDKRVVAKESRKLLQKVDSLTESLKKTQDELKSERLKAHCRELLESANVELNDTRLKALQRAADDDEREELLESWPTIEQIKERKRPDYSPGRFSESAGGKFPESLDDFKKSLR